MRKDQFDIVRLIRSENIGIRTYHNLRDNFSSTTEILEFLQEGKSSIPGKQIKLAQIPDVEKEIYLTKKLGAKFIFLEDEYYPENLKFIDDAPPFIIALGNIELLKNKNTIAVVGARNAAFNSLQYTKRIIDEISNNNFNVVSGMARGIDAAAHEACIEKTIAVLPGGIDYVYPPEHKNLYAKIKKNGCLITENKIRTQPSLYHFPQRNRIIAGMGIVTIIVEATIKSGSLITAKLAANYNRDVYAVPGFPLDQKFSGNNYLIKNGACLLDKPSEIFENIKFQIMDKAPNRLNKIKVPKKIKQHSEENHKNQKNVHDQILEKIAYSPTDIDDLANLLQISIAKIQVAIIELELEGKVKRTANNSIINSSLEEYCAEYIA